MVHCIMLLLFTYVILYEVLYSFLILFSYFGGNLVGFSLDLVNLNFT